MTHSPLRPRRPIGARIVATKTPQPIRYVLIRDPTVLEERPVHQAYGWWELAGDEANGLGEPVSCRRCGQVVARRFPDLLLVAPGLSRRRQSDQSVAYGLSDYNRRVPQWARETKRRNALPPPPDVPLGVPTIDVAPTAAIYCPNCTMRTEVAL